MNNEETEQIKTSIEYLSTLVLENTGIHRNYTDEELSDVMLIFMEVFMAKMYDKHAIKLTHSKLEQLSTEAGKSLHQTVLLFTGVDLHKIYEK